MAFYDQTPKHLRQQSWEPSQTSSRLSSGANTVSQGEDGLAFRAQFEEIERAHDNLIKTGRPFPPMHSRRESLPSAGGPFMSQFPTDRGGPPRHHSIGEYEHMRSGPAPGGLQGYLAHQRFPTPRQNDAESMMQVKRRAAAQRERELRNYHQEQQYNRNQPGSKSDRSISPNAMNEEDRRELIAKQHRALYGEGANIYDGNKRPISQDARVLAAAGGGTGHSSSPLGFDSFNQTQNEGADGSVAASANTVAGGRSRSNSASIKPTNAGNLGLYDGGHNANRASSTSPGVSTQAGGASSAGAIGPIGSRGPQSAVPKRTTPPSGASNTPASATTEKPGSLGWGSSNGPWGGASKGSLGQASVWG